MGEQVNSAANDFCPTLARDGHTFYFVSNRVVDDSCGGGDIYLVESHGGVFGPPDLVPGVNSLGDDGHPNVRRDGLEISFYSVRSDLPDAQCGPDIHKATRATTADPGSPPVNLGPGINSPASQTRPSLARDGSELYFGSTRRGRVTCT